MHAKSVDSLDLDSLDCSCKFSSWIHLFSWIHLEIGAFFADSLVDSLENGSYCSLIREYMKVGGLLKRLLPRNTDYSCARSAPKKLGHLSEGFLTLAENRLDSLV